MKISFIFTLVEIWFSPKIGMYTLIPDLESNVKVITGRCTVYRIAGCTYFVPGAYFLNAPKTLPKFSTYIIAHVTYQVYANIMACTQYAN